MLNSKENGFSAKVKMSHHKATDSKSKKHKVQPGSYSIYRSQNREVRFENYDYPELWHVGSLQPTYLGPERNFAHINSLQ